MTLNKLQENLTKKGYTSEEVDVWTAGYVYALNHQPDLKPLVAEVERLRAAANAVFDFLDANCDDREIVDQLREALAGTEKV